MSVMNDLRNDDEFSNAFVASTYIIVRVILLTKGWFLMTLGDKCSKTWNVGHYHLCGFSWYDGGFMPLLSRLFTRKLYPCLLLARVAIY